VKAGDRRYLDLFDEQIRGVFRDALKVTLRHPSLAMFFARTVTGQRRAARRRLELEAQGLLVPPLLIASITHSCNLKCQGCYARTAHWAATEELSIARWREIISEAADLGIALVMLAGGEPLTRPHILDVTRGFPHVIFPLFTNGLLLKRDAIRELMRQRHVIPIISLEGFGPETDERRGEGVYGRVLTVLDKLKGSDIFFGVSLTVTRDNFATLTRGEFEQTLHDAGCRLFIFVEYTPVQDGTEALTLTRDQKLELVEHQRRLQSRFGSVVIGFPGDEEQYGGCLAAGRGFVHVGPDGDLEPCPFAPYSDTSVRTLSLRQALQSELLARIRAGHERLQETSGGCALWANRDWVRSLLMPGD
jgi:MoaA/NifB/PqqE/SkfB family radical SAM enzyme